MTIQNVNFHLKYKCEQASYYYNSDLKTIICSADQSYISIENFKKLFGDIADFLEYNQVQNLIFDKSNLRTFHQPSMEWYFTEWKIKAKEKGLVNHFKILPKLEWFVKSVEAGKSEIYQKYPADYWQGIQINYAPGLEELLLQISSKSHGNNKN